MCLCPLWAYGTVNDNAIRQSLNTNDIELARQAITNLTRLPASISSNLTSVLAPLFLQSCKDQKLAHNTVIAYANTLKFFTSYYPVAITSVSVSSLDSYRAYRQISSGSWRKELIHLRTFFKWCIARGYCTSNPALSIKPPKEKELTTPPFTKGEVTALITACKTAKDKALVYTLLYSGLRISDVTLLKQSALLLTSGHLTLRTLKTGATITVKLPPVAIESLHSLPPSKYFFYTGESTLKTATEILRCMITKIGKHAKVTNTHPHRFRDTFAVTLLTNGVDIRVIQLLLGHSSVTTTEKHYAHFVIEHQKLLDTATSTLVY